MVATVVHDFLLAWLDVLMATMAPLPILLFIESALQWRVRHSVGFARLVVQLHVRLVLLVTRGILRGVSCLLRLVRR